MAARRHHAKRRGKPATVKSWVIRVLLLAVVGAIAWWAVTGAMTIKQKISAYPTKTSHAFITTEDKNPVLLVIEQGQQTAQLSSLMVMRFDHEQRSISAIQLPANLSDGQTTAAEYLESGYYKELQQMVEQTLALPINGYIIQPRSIGVMGQASWPSVLARQPKPSWWQTTIDAPWWLGRQPMLKTNISTWQLMQLLWLARDADESNVNIHTAAAALFHRNQDGNLVADTSQLDTVVKQVLADQQAIDEGVSVVVKNATDVSGMAGLVSRYVSHLGGEVIAVEASDSGQVNSSMKSEKASRLSQNIESMLGVPLTTTSLTGRERSDMELVVGVDMLNRVGKPIISQ